MNDAKQHLDNAESGSGEVHSRDRSLAEPGRDEDLSPAIALLSNRGSLSSFSTPWSPADSRHLVTTQYVDVGSTKPRRRRSRTGERGHPGRPTTVHRIRRPPDDHSSRVDRVARASRQGRTRTRSRSDERRVERDLRHLQSMRLLRRRRSCCGHRAGLVRRHQPRRVRQRQRNGAPLGGSAENLRVPIDARHQAPAGTR